MTIRLTAWLKIVSHIIGSHTDNLLADQSLSYISYCQIMTVILRDLDDVCDHM